MSRPTENAERHMVCIETEKAGTIEMTPEQFDMLLECALVGLSKTAAVRMEDSGVKVKGANSTLELKAMVERAYARHTAQ